jgi:hypothetical protein
MGVDVLSEIPGVRNVAVVRRSGDQVDWRFGTDELVVAVIGVMD